MAKWKKIDAKAMSGDPVLVCWENKTTGVAFYSKRYNNWVSNDLRIMYSAPLYYIPIPKLPEAQA